MQRRIRTGDHRLSGCVHIKKAVRLVCGYFRPGDVGLSFTRDRKRCHYVRLNNFGLNYRIPRITARNSFNYNEILCVFSRSNKVP